MGGDVAGAGCGGGWDVWRGWRARDARPLLRGDDREVPG